VIDVYLETYDNMAKVSLHDWFLLLQPWPCNCTFFFYEGCRVNVRGDPFFHFHA
jgi:hypothetical protein